MTALFSTLASVVIVPLTAFAVGGAGVGGGGDWRMNGRANINYQIEAFNQSCLDINPEVEPSATCIQWAETLFSPANLCGSELPTEKSLVQFCRNVRGKPQALRGSNHFICECKPGR